MVTVIMGLLVAAVRCAPTPAFAHDGTIKNCFGTDHTTKLQEAINENGTISELYDRNRDGKIDIEVISTITTVDVAEDGKITYNHRATPLLFIVDENFDGEPDMVFIDPAGEGKCSDIRLYQNLLHGGGRNPSSGKTGL